MGVGRIQRPPSLLAVSRTGAGVSGDAAGRRRADGAARLAEALSLCPCGQVRGVGGSLALESRFWQDTLHRVHS